MSIIPAKQVAALESLSTQYTTGIIFCGSSYAPDHEVQQVVSVAGTNLERMFIRNIRLSRSASQYNSGAYGTYDGSNGYSLRVELWSWVTDSYDYTSATIDVDGPSLLQWQQVNTTNYNAGVQSLVVDFPLSHWFGPTFPDVSTSPIKFAIVVVDDSSLLSPDTSRYDVTVQYDKVRST